MLNRSFATGREAGGIPLGRAATLRLAVAPASAIAFPAHQGRGNANLRLAEAILAREARTVIVPNLEPVDPDQGDVPWLDPEAEIEDPSFSAQMDDEENEEQPRDEDGRFVRQDDEEEEPPPDDEEEVRQAKDVDITIVDVDEEIEDGPDEDEPAYQVPQVPA